MPFNGAGTFTVYTPGNPIANGDTSNAVYFNNTMTDFATGLSNTLTKDGQGVPTANIPMGNNKITGLANGTVSTDAAAYGQVTAAISTAATAAQNGSQTYLTSVSGTNTITANLSGLTAYTAGLTVRFTAVGANTGAVTLNIGSLGAINLVRADGVALATGDLLTSGTYEAVYDGASFKLQGSVAPSQLLTGTQIQNVTAVAASNTMIVTLGATTLDFRNTNLTIGTPNRRTLGTASNITIPQGATLGASNGVPYTIYAGAIDNAGTIEPIVGGINCNFDESQLINTTAISNAANSSNVFYSTTARTNVPLRNLGLVSHNQSTAGTYAAQPTQVQGNGGITQTGQFKYLQFPSIATTSGTTADQLNIPSWAKRITVRSRGLSTNGTSAKQLQLGAGSFVTSGYLSQGSGGANGNVISGFSMTTGFGIGSSSTAANTNYFSYVLQYEGAGVWTYTATNSGNVGQSELWVCGGELTLTGGTLDRIRLTTVNGTDTFDAGSFSVLVEG